VSLTQQQIEAKMKSTLEEGGDRSARTHPPGKNKFKKKNPKEKTVWVEVPSPPHGEPRY